MFDAVEIQGAYRFRKHVAKFSISTPTAWLCELRDEPDEPLTLTMLKVISCDVILRKMPVATAKDILEMLLRINNGPVSLKLVQPIKGSIEFIEAEDAGLIQCA